MDIFKNVTLGTAVYDDFDGLYFTIKSIQLHHPEVFENAEIIVVDNNPKGIIGPHIEEFVKKHNQRGNMRYVPVEYPVGTAPAKQKIFEHATRDWVVVFDSHVLFPPNSFSYFAKYAEQNPDSKDIITGPLLHDDGIGISTHFMWEWRGQNLGTWRTDKRGYNVNGEPFEISGSGMGLFAMKKEYWPGFHPAMRGFGAEELYIHEKVRKNGGRAICIPGFRWVHRFSRPRGIPYPILMWHKVRNYVIAFMDLGLDIQEIHDYFVGGGFFSEENWNILMSDPIKNENPPPGPPVAVDAPEKPLVENYVKTHKAVSVEVQNNPQSEALSPEKIVEIAEQFDKRAEQYAIPKEVYTKVPIETKIHIMKFNEQQIDNVMRSLAENVKRRNNALKNENKQGGCGCKGQKIEARQEVVKFIKSKQNIKELLNVPEGYRSITNEHVQILKNLVETSKYILAITDDPLGVPVVVLNYMSEDSAFACHYEDQKYVPEFAEIIRIANNSSLTDRTYIFYPGLPNAKDIDTQIDLLILDPINPSYQKVIDIVAPILDKLTGRIVINQANKYAYRSAESEDPRTGILMAAREIRKRDPEWTVIEFNKSGNGMLVMSKLEQDKPKMPSLKVTGTNFLKSLWRHIKTGAQVVSKEVLEKRLAKCEVCPHLLVKDGKSRCSICGCYLIDGPGGIGKAVWKYEECPLGYWSADTNE
ncbi:MAG: hypothetical protein KatS3mg087_0077 [Patescibacteria group bacterium]|nr:MAG: hypothetical protein KatS3mg087_0077 [Patescibacteria group bacterium]